MRQSIHKSAWLKRTDSLKVVLEAPNITVTKKLCIMHHVRMYLYILEIFEQRLPKACTAISSSALLIYPRAISSLNLVQNHTLHGQPIMSCDKDTHCFIFFLEIGKSSYFKHTWYEAYLGAGYVKLTHDLHHLCMVDK